MRVETLGSGEPTVAVIAGIHGDEPSGVRAVERILEADPAVDRGVKLIIANEEALAQETRYVDRDLNRSFLGDPDSEFHEVRLAAELAAELTGCSVLALHSTQSYAEPFAIVNEPGEYEQQICPRLPVDAVVDARHFDNGRIFSAHARTIEIECGLQGSDEAADNATRVVRAFLRATGALADTEPDPARDLPAFRLTRAVSKAEADSYEVYPQNFERVESGEPFAAAGDRQFVADEPFYPVLMSPYGYEELFGYAAEKVDSL